MNGPRHRADERGRAESPLRYAAVFPLVRTRAFAEAFDYAVPPELEERVVPGALVAVPLGPQTVIGVVLESRAETTHAGRVVDLRDVLDVSAVPPDLLELARRVEAYYLTSFAAALALVCPPTGALRVLRSWQLTDAGRAALEAGEEALERLDGLKVSGGPVAKLAEVARRADDRRGGQGTR